jgi:hypothetical protein
MRNEVRDRVAELTVEECQQIHKEYCQFEEEGSIGDCLLREITESFQLRSNPIIMMEIVIREVWRKLAMDLYKLDDID